MSEHLASKKVYDILEALDDDNFHDTVCQVTKIMLCLHLLDRDFELDTLQYCGDQVKDWNTFRENMADVQSWIQVLGLTNKEDEEKGKLIPEIRKFCRKLSFMEVL